MAGPLVKQDVTARFAGYQSLGGLSGGGGVGDRMMANANIPQPGPSISTPVSTPSLKGPGQ